MLEMKEKIRIGILGGGGILGAHAPAYMKLQDICSVVMVAEPKPERAKIIHSLLGPEVRIVKDYHDVLDVGDVDAVDIILPHDLHKPATIDSAKAGKPILTEKVMARNIWECDRMIEACEKAGVSLTVCHDRRYNGEWMALKDVVDSGVLGEIFFWKLEHNQDVLFPEDSWARTRNGIGGGAIMSCLTHQIDACRSAWKVSFSVLLSHKCHQGRLLSFPSTGGLVHNTGQIPFGMRWCRSAERKEKPII
jgi:UDP-N-acetyl-2-amino-2-deoxyglucuronate dehydrogenase